MSASGFDFTTQVGLIPEPKLLHDVELSTLNSQSLTFFIWQEGAPSSVNL